MSADKNVRTPLGPCQFVGSKHKAFYAAAGDESIHDRGDVRESNASVKEMVGLDQNGYTGGALIEATRRANARLYLGQSARRHFRF